ncbi:MAG: hypothetical protein IPH43_03585 [Xanthomonadales bacterium]|nr:hypothetical protein [Xanthomonadales bacterium]
MIKYILLAAVWILPCAIAQAQPATPWNVVVKESIDATHVPEMPTSPDGTLAPSDLTLDTGFLNTGMIPIYPSIPPANGTEIEDGLRVFPWRVCNPLCTHRGYYLVGRVKNTDGTWHSSITRRNIDGTLDPTFGTNGWMYPSSTVTDVADAALGAGKMYILTTVDLGGVPVMRATCTDLTSGAACFTGFGGIVSFGATSSGAIRSAHARRIAYDSRYGVFIAGRVFTVARGWELAAARLDADTGSLVTEFHGDGMNIGLPAYAAQTAADVDILELAVTPAGNPGTERLYIAGTVKLTAADYDGFVLGLDPVSGFSTSGWTWPQVYFEGDNLDFKKDAVTAVTVLRTGRVVMAGWSETDAASERVAFLERRLNDSTPDASFCTAPSSGKCRIPVRPLIGVVNDELPVAIAERYQNRDLVVAMKTRTRSGDYHPAQTVMQISSSGNVLHALQTLDFAAAAGGAQWSRPFGMWVGNIAFSTEPVNEVVAVAGTRFYNATDYDGTLSQMKANDSIFADPFGGSQND